MKSWKVEFSTLKRSNLIINTFIDDAKLFNGL